MIVLQVESVNSDGSNRRTILTTNQSIARPTALAVMDRRLYYLDPQYEKVVRVDLPNGDNPKTLMDNENDLRTLNIYRKRPRPPDHPCQVLQISPPTCETVVTCSLCSD